MQDENIAYKQWKYTCMVSLSSDWMTIKEMQVPIVVVLKAMGMESDQEIVQMVGRDPKYAGILAPSLQVCTTCLLLMLGTFHKHSLIRENSWVIWVLSYIACSFFHAGVFCPWHPHSATGTGVPWCQGLLAIGLSILTLLTMASRESRQIDALNFSLSKHGSYKLLVKTH